MSQIHNSYPGSIAVPPGAAQKEKNAQTFMVGEPHASDVKQGAKCCGFCCDYRRAVIIVSIVLFILKLIGLIAILVSGAYMVNTPDSSSNEWQNHMNDYEMLEIISGAVSMITCIFAIMGAYLFNVWLVGVNALWLMVGYILGIYNVINLCSDWDGMDNPSTEYTCTTNPGAIAIGFVIILLFVYPHVGFIVEVKKGIMTKETYKREEFSCCCV